MISRSLVLQGKERRLINQLINQIVQVDMHELIDKVMS